uniref:Candidate secreted effector n=1 Tax=Meloidogyne incognita TaxID=6306 RepID=A0A914MY06_MELIC
MSKGFLYLSALSSPQILSTSLIILFMFSFPTSRSFSLFTLFSVCFLTLSP